MTMNLIPFAMAGAVLVLTVIVLYVWRRTVARQEDDSLHMLADSAAIPQQVALAHKLAVLDRWGKVLTLLAALYVIAIGAIFVYQQWLMTSRTVVP